MSGDWIHCNSCIALPAQNVQFLFTSCGHIVCKACLSKSDGRVCPYCKKNAQFMEINRTLRGDIQMLFRNPRDLATEYMKNLGTTLDFQQSHRSRLTRAQHEQQKKALKYIGAAQGEMKKRMDAERKALSENKEIKTELEKNKVQVQKLEALLATRELELERLRSAAAFPSPRAGVPGVVYQRSVDSGLGDTPMSSLSFIDAITSTPINCSPARSNSSSGRRRSKERLQQMFQSSGGTIPSPIVSTPGLLTPAMLGITKKRSSSEHSRRPSSTNNKLYFDNDAMEIGGF